MERTYRSGAVVVRAWCGEILRRGGVDNHRMTICVLRVQVLLLSFMRFLFDLFLDIVLVIYYAILNVAHSTI
jgi:hypothetical protein